MASVGHVFVGVAAAAMDGRAGRPRLGAALAWSCLSLLPDLDVIGFRFGIRYADPWGHRGATHSFVFAAAIALASVPVAALLRRSTVRTAIATFLVVASHAVLDTLTDGGLGCALLWPFSDQRFFAPWRPLPVAPIGRRFLSIEGLRVASLELLLVAPALALLYVLWRTSRRREPSS